MAVAFKGVGSIWQQSSSGSITPELPAYAAGDLLVLSIAHTNSTPPAAPSGWTLFASPNYSSSRALAAYYRVATASETSPTVSVATGCSAKIASFSGVNTTTPLMLVEQNSAYTSSVTAAGFTPPAAGCYRLVMIACLWDAESSGGMTDSIGTQNGQAGSNYQAMSEFGQALSTTSAVSSTTHSNGRTDYTAWATVDLFPASYSPPPPISFRATGSAYQASSGTTATPGLPTYSAGDLLLATFATYPNSAAITSLPTGWKSLGRIGSSGSASINVCWKIATASESAPTFTFNSFTGITGSISSFSNVDPTNPFPNPKFGQGYGSSWSVPAINVPISGYRVVGLAGPFGSFYGGYGTSGGMSDTVAQSGGYSGTNYVGLTMYGQSNPQNAATTATGNGTDYAAYFALGLNPVGTPVVATWDADTNVLLTLTNNNLSAANGTGSYGYVRASLGHDTGKYYFEIEAATGASGHQIGMVPASVNMSSGIPNNNPGIGFAQGSIYRNTAPVATPSQTLDSTHKNVGVAVDFTNGKVWFSVNGVWINSGDPATNSNGWTFTPGEMWYPEIAPGSGNGTLTLKPSSTTTTYSAPTGFDYWEPSPVTRKAVRFSYWM